MRSAFFIVLLLTTTVAQFGTAGLVLVQHQRGRRRTEMLRTRKQGEEQGVGLVHLVVLPAGQSTASPSLVRVGRREVRYEGHLYDVVFETLRGDTLHLWVHWDEHEEAALDQLAQTYGARPTGIAAPAPNLKTQPLFYLSLYAAAVRPPLPGRLRHAPRRERTSVAPFDEVPHPPPQG